MFDKINKAFSFLDRNNKIDENSRFIELDAFRGIAALLVLLSHYTWAYDYHFKTLDEHVFHFEYGDFGVQLFFIISGFVIFMTLEKMNSVYEFAVHRFARLYPVYWISMTITIITISIFPVPGIGDYSLKEIIANLTMLQSFFHIRHVDQVYWSLKIELLFYFLMGILFYFKKLDKIEIISILWLMISILTMSIDFSYEKYLKVLLITKNAPLFIAGMMFYKIRYKPHNLLHHLIILISLVVYSISFYFELVIRNFTEVNAIYFLLIILGFLLFYLVLYFKISFFQNKYLLFFGYISYPLYLLHNTIGASIIYRIKMYNDNEFIYTVIPFLVSTFLAYIVTKTMEKPSYKLRMYLLHFKNKFEKLNA